MSTTPVVYILLTINMKTANMRQKYNLQGEKQDGFWCSETSAISRPHHQPKLTWHARYPANSTNTTS